MIINAKSAYKAITNMTNTFRCTLFTILVFISGCSTVPQSIIVAPDTVALASSNIVSSKSLTHKSISLNTEDLRSSKHIVQITKKNKAAQLVNSETSLQQLIQTTLYNEYKKKSVNITQQSSNQLNVNIVSAVIDIKQSFFKYTAESVITLSVTFKNGEQILTKNFRRTGKSHGPLKADLAVLARDFNQQLGNTLNLLVNDPEIRALIK